MELAVIAVATTQIDAARTIEAVVVIGGFMLAWRRFKPEVTQTVVSASGDAVDAIHTSLEALRRDLAVSEDRRHQAQDMLIAAQQGMIASQEALIKQSDEATGIRHELRNELQVAMTERDLAVIRIAELQAELSVCKAGGHTRRETDLK